MVLSLVGQRTLILLTGDGRCRFGKASEQGLSLKRAGPLPAVKVGDPQHDVVLYGVYVCSLGV